MTSPPTQPDHHSDTTANASAATTVIATNITMASSPLDPQEQSSRFMFILLLIEAVQVLLAFGL